MTRAEMTRAIRRIMAGEKATLVVRPEKEAEARRLLAGMPPSIASLLTIVVKVGS